MLLTLREFVFQLFRPFIFAHLARAAAAMRARPAAEIRRLGAPLELSVDLAFCFAQRAYKL